MGVTLYTPVVVYLEVEYILSPVYPLEFKSHSIDLLIFFQGKPGTETVSMTVRTGYFPSKRKIRITKRFQCFYLRGGGKIKRSQFFLPISAPAWNSFP